MLKGTLTPGLLLAISLLFLSGRGLSQDLTDPGSWAASLPKRTLVIVVPTFTVKHQRIQSSVQNHAPEARGRLQAERIMQRDRSYRDTLLLALSASFQEHYQFGKVRLMPDTSYARWQKGLSPLTWIDLEGKTATLSGIVNNEVIFLKKKKTSRETGTGVEVWMASTPDRQDLPGKFPDQFREGSLGTRFIRFLEAFLTFTTSPDTLEEQRVITDYLARQVDRKWSAYIDSLEE